MLPSSCVFILFSFQCICELGPSPTRDRVRGGQHELHHALGKFRLQPAPSRSDPRPSERLGRGPWSQPVYTATNVLIHLDKKPLTKVQDLYGQKVGTILSFIYPDLDKDFQDKKIIREDGPNIESNIKKLLHGRINYIVTTHFEYNYHEKIHPELQLADLKMTSFKIRCALSKKSKITLTELNKAIDTIKNNGTLEKILRPYENQ